MERLFLQLCFILNLAACGGGGGESATAPPPATTTNNSTPSTNTQPAEEDKRAWFQDYFWEEYLTFDNGRSEWVSVTFTQGEFVPSSDLPSNNKYKTVDYNFLQIIAKGVHYGHAQGTQNPEQAEPGVWSVSFNNFFHETDINRDGFKDFLAVVYFDGSRSNAPQQKLIAMLNDGEGHFYLEPSIFGDYDFPCMGQGSHEAVDDPLRACGNHLGHQRTVFADFNNDGVDDVYQTSKLILSNNGILYDVSQDNLPDVFFNENDVWTHGITSGDFDGDGNLDIFVPAQSHNWMILENDGRGVFTDRTVGVPRQQCAPGCFDGMIWATAATAGDLNNDGFDEIIVGWYNPDQSTEHTIGAPSVPNSAGAVYINRGPNVRPEDQFDTIVTLPESFYGANGNANDMDIIDFDGDGYKDIILASTRHDPYYKGRAIQFFRTVVNGNEITFEDVTEVYNPRVNMYASGSKIDSMWWNGEGQLRIVDFDGDGDLDIVDSNRETYVLINQDYNYFEMLDSNQFPRVAGNGKEFSDFYPIDVDNNANYDFVTYSRRETSDTRINDFYILLSK